MNFIKKNISYIVTGLVIAAVLTTAFFFGDSSNTSGPELSSTTTASLSSAEKSTAISETESVASYMPGSSLVSAVSEKNNVRESTSAETESKPASSEINSVVSRDQNHQSEISVGEKITVTQVSRTYDSPNSVINNEKHDDTTVSESAVSTQEESIISDKEPEQTVSEDTVISSVSSRAEYICKLYISCATAVRNDKLDKVKLSVLPSDGEILGMEDVSFSDGESVFDVLKRECIGRKIHLDFSSIPVTGGAYIKGISNLYEFDCGPVSGWMYRVNGEYPMVGCSDYLLKEGDVVEFLYSCDLGADIGNIYKGE